PPRRTRAILRGCSDGGAGRTRAQLGSPRDRRARGIGGHGAHGRDRRDGTRHMRPEEPLSVPWTGRGVPYEYEAARLPARRLPLIHLLLLATTALTTTVAGLLCEGLDPTADPRLLVRGLPFAVTLITILLVHEAGHYVMCRTHGV